MANITLGQLRDLWQAVADWANGLKEPKVQLSGSYFQPVTRVITTAPLAAGGTFNTDTVLDVTAAPGIGLLAYSVSADTLVQVRVAATDGPADPQDSAEQLRIEATLYRTNSAGAAWWIPPFRPVAGKLKAFFSNPTASAQTRLRIVEWRFPYTTFFPQNLRAVLADGLAVRDTNVHNANTDPAYMFRLTRFWLGGGKVPIFVQNGANQEASVSPVITVSGLMSGTLGTKAVPAFASIVITNQDFPGLDVPSETIRIDVKYTVAPTSGTLSAFIDTLVGGSS